MRIDNYEIDMLNVNAADAFFIRFWDSDTGRVYVVLVDGGNYSNGEAIFNFMKNTYNCNKIDLAICTHCDDDHYGGFIWLLEQMRLDPLNSVKIEQMIVNDPGKHVHTDEAKWYKDQSNLEKEARSVFTLSTGENLFDELDKSGVSHCEAFSNENYFFLDSHIEIVGPTKEYYESLVYKFRNSISQYDDSDAIIDDSTITNLYGTAKVVSKTLDEASDDSSSHNQSSIMFLFKPSNGLKYLFMGDAGREAVDKMQDIDKECTKDVFWIKVPHHGSKHNMDSDMINHLKPNIAYISTEKVGHYLSMATVNALKKIGAKVYSTHKNSNMCHNAYSMYPNRPGYSTAEAM